MSAPELDQGALRNWRAKAACRSVDPELFFPEPSNEPVIKVQIAAAKAVCRRCPVRERCLADALERLPHGIAGGLTEQERRRLRTARGMGTGRRPRWLVLLENGCSHLEVARECGVSVRTVARWVSRRRGELDASVSGDRR
ncbi:WhiB family transcriptional regulator [Actinomycetospora sp. CA-101289]|uniref:WhiB family transcriptional regulator n=1 Tax=Actinomycetospora sp. CA-101289 TaxID=3239893 RepID=UPI003D96F183